MKFIKDRQKKRKIRRLKGDLQAKVISLGEAVVILEKFKLNELILLKADIDATIENMKQIGFIAIVVGFMITFYTELIKKTLTIDDGISILIFLVVIIGLMFIAGTYARLYHKNLLYQKLIELKIKEKEEKVINLDYAI
ncbi:hypothetical protein [Paenibacillus sp. GCM10027626]|uniref:hypothetical protein n=1 Tax=Paenibacillus sp. GCM10027626 TaxID=3273411 RepID=UPI00363E4C06